MLEPFVFFAVLALYIEFPAVQDLIYTKICLQVLSQHQQNLTIGTHYVPSSPLTDALSATTATEISLDVSLSSSGLIQSPSTASNATSLLPIRHNYSYNTHDLKLLCSGKNRSTIPLEMRQDILDLDSVFWLKYQLIISAIGVLATPYWGGVSDRIGRLIPLNVPISASLICNLISLLLSILMGLDLWLTRFPVEWLFAGAIIVGLSGGQPVLISNSFSYLSDNTSSEDRSKRVTILESTIFVAHSLGFLLSKLIMPLGLDSLPWKNRHIVAFGVIVMLNLFCLIYSIFCLRHKKFHRFLNNFEREQREAAVATATVCVDGHDDATARTSPKLSYKNLAAHSQTAPTTGERPRELTSSTPDDLDGPVARADKSNWTIWDTMITFRYFKETYSAAVKPRECRAIILLLLLSGFISALSLATLMSLLFVYVKMDPINWSTSQYSVWNSISSIARGAALIVLTLGMKFYSGWNVPDPLVSALGFLSKGSGLLLIGFADDSKLLYWSLCCLTLSEYAMPPIRSILSKLVVNEELCKIYSCIGSLQNVCFILGNVAFYAAFHYSITRKDYFRLSFMVAAAFEFVAAIIMLIIYTSLRRRILVI